MAELTPANNADADTLTLGLSPGRTLKNAKVQLTVSKSCCLALTSDLICSMESIFL